MISKALPAALLAVIAAHAQWLHYPTAKVPKTADGSPNLNAPAPLGSDGKPDLSGLWTMMCPTANGLVLCLPETYVPREFADIGRSLDGGLPYQPWAAALVAARRAENGKDDPFTHCLPGTVARIHTVPFLRKIVQTPGLVIFLSEANASYRQIFIDGRPQPDDPNPSWNGYSTGHWDGDTLVVETSGFRDGQWLDRFGSPLTDKAKMTERFRRVNYGTLEIEFTVDDPKAYTKPWTVRLNQSIALNTELMDWICLENEKDFPHLVGK
ncbi:MAG TPA: hypothetical protein VG096_25590 [Bryobacteraceae bacterium]|jgi:hypothetical protein|nr:hypothetical protein [Bryobacteraceae bacterium]